MPIVRLYVCLCLILPLLASRVQAQESVNNVALGLPVAGDLEAGEADRWRFNGEAGQVLTLSAERFPASPESRLDLVLEIYDAAGTLLASDNDSAPGTDAMLLNLTLPQTGDYDILVKNGNLIQGGSYLFAIEASPFTAECASPLGTMQTGEMPSAIAGTNVRYRVFYPPCHEQQPVRYPYILLMHGSNSDDRLWDSLEMDEAIVRAMALNRVPPVALVLPFGSALANLNVFRPEYSWEYVVINEFMPFVEANYCLQNTRAARAIGGISRGGFWAFEIAFRHPELFSTLGGHSPYFDLYHAPATHNPLDLVLASAPAEPLRIWIDRGREDYAQVNIDLIHDRMTQNNLEHTYRLYAVGQHNNDYWSAHVGDYLDFYTEEWTDLPLPECYLQ